MKHQNERLIAAWGRGEKVGPLAPLGLKHLIFIATA
jgi:hypothetical protein